MEFMALYVYCMSCMCRLILLTKFEKFSNNIEILFFPLFFSPFGAPVIFMLVGLMAFRRSLSLCLFFSLFFIFLFLEDNLKCLALPSSLQIPPSGCLNLLLWPLLNFSFQLTYFSTLQNLMFSNMALPLNLHSLFKETLFSYFSLVLW